ncbi:MAG: hypothetical protein AB1331_03145 [Bacillota bacterium]
MEEYEISEPQVEFIRHNENLTCSVTDGQTGERYVLRVHQPIEGFAATAQHSHEALEAELQFMEVLGQGTQRPVRNRAGR